MTKREKQIESDTLLLVDRLGEGNRGELTAEKLAEALAAVVRLRNAALGQL